MESSRVSLISGLLVAALLVPAAAWADTDTLVYLQKEEIAYVGELSAAANKQVIEVYERADPKPKWLAIRSGGGEIGVGMALGEWIADHNLGVRVLEYCLSSCANYVFTAAHKRVVSNFAVIGYHGGANSATFANELPPSASSEERLASSDALDAYIAKVAPREHLFFDKLGINPRIVLLGQFPEVEKVMGVDSRSDVACWTYSLTGFHLLGIDNIEVVNGPWVPKLLSGKEISIQLGDAVVKENLRTPLPTRVHTAEIATGH